MHLINCGCAKTGKRFEAVFEGRELVEIRKPPAISFLEKIQARGGRIPVKDINASAIRCLSCLSKMFLCDCGLVCCRGRRQGDQYACLCGKKGTLGLVADDALVSGGKSVKALVGPSVRLLR